MTDRAVLWVPGRPVPAARPRFSSRSGTTYTPAPYSEWKSEAAWRMRTGTPGTFDGPVAVGVSVGVDGVTVTVEGAPLLRPKGLRGDLDNYVKAALDALQDSGVIGNDVAVQSVSASFR